MGVRRRVYRPSFPYDYIYTVTCCSYLRGRMLQKYLGKRYKVQCIYMYIHVCRKTNSICAMYNVTQSAMHEHVHVHVVHMHGVVKETLTLFPP